MDQIKLTEFLVKSIVKNPDQVIVTKQDENTILVKVSKKDIKTVIGQSGKMANSIRTIVQTSSYVKNKDIKINIESL